MTHEIAVIPGDGIGQEVTPAAVDVLEALDLEFEFIEADAGDAVKAETGEALPQETYDLAASADATLFGAAGETAADVILPLRDAVDSYVNIRPAKATPASTLFDRRRISFSSVRTPKASTRASRTDSRRTSRR